MQVLNLPKDRCTIEGKIFFWYADKSYDTSRSGHADRVGHKGLYQGGVAFVCSRKDLGWQGADCEDIGLVEGTSIEEAFGMLEGYENRGDRSLVSLGQMLREILQEVDFVGDLGMRRDKSASTLGDGGWDQRACAYDDVRLDLGRDDRVLAYPIPWG